jgi:MtrB/PioB family decaheme-associated outer membrane protein
MKTRFLLPLALCLAPAARADEASPEWRELVMPISRVEIEAVGVRAATPSFADATGIDPHGGPALGFDLRGGSTYDQAERQRWRLVGARLGQDDAALRGEYAEQGHYRLKFAFDGMTRHGPEGYATPFLGVGGTALTLPAGLAQASANPVVGAAALDAATRAQPLARERRRGEVAGNLWLTPHWEFRASLGAERQTGLHASGATMGSGGSSIAMILPEPVDSLTRNIDASLGYQAPGRHLRLAYSGSFFGNDVEAYGFQNPFGIANTLLDNRMALAPDNQAHQLTLSGAYNLGATTRINASAGYGRATQDAPFLPYATAPGTPTLPRASLDGEVISRQARVKLSSRPAPGWRLDAAYKADSRDNRTPIAEYILPGVSSARLGEVGAANIALSNTPYSRDNRLAEVDLGYMPRAGGDVALSLRREDIARDCHDDSACVEVPETRETGWRLEWRREFLPGVGGRFSYAASERRGDDYQRYVDSLELAGMRKFFLADRDRDQARAVLNASLDEAWSLGLALDLNRDRYSQSPYGLQAADSRAAHVDLAYAPDNEVSASLFLGREALRAKLFGSYSTSSLAGVAQPQANGQWRVDMDDDIDTLGISLRHKGLRGGRLELSVDLAFIHSRSPYRVVGGARSASATTDLTPQALPVLSSLGHELRLGLRHALDDHAALRVAYLYRRLRGDDYAYDLYAENNLTRLLGSGETTPKHDAHILAVAYEYRFR